MKHDVDILEFAIFHWIYNKSPNLPGVQNGLPNGNFFDNLRKRNSQENYEENLNSFFYEKILNSKCFEDPSYILCSGGIDSSIVSLSADYQKSDFILLHTAYINHDNNDLEKLIRVVQQFPCQTNIFSVGPNEYKIGLQYMWDNSYFQNTYTPTLLYTLKSCIKNNFRKNLITGCGPDELFYGMEKYDWNFFESLKCLKIQDALEKIDTSYNLNSYKKILNPMGLEILNEVIKNRKKLYLEISKIYSNIFDAQRLLAYCTVTGQHLDLFQNVSSFVNLNHISPFLNEELVALAFSIPTEKLLTKISDKRVVEDGKKHLKKFLSKFMNKDHVYSKKIGFHAPTTSFMRSKPFKSLFQNLNYDKLPKFLDIDKTRKLIRFELENKEINDYFLYSIINLAFAKNINN